MCTFVLKNTVQYYTRYSGHVFACFIDCNKAFDEVDYWLLFCTLYDTTANSDMKMLCFTQPLAQWYSMQFAYVRWNGAISGSAGIRDGVEQDGILSPYIFCIYVHDLKYVVN